MKGNLNEINVSTSSLTLYYMPRLRIEKILDQATNGKLVFVVAGIGYGKTQTIYNYVRSNPDYVVRWLQITESDNAGSRHWENLIHTVACDNPDLAEKMYEIGFPETGAQFKRFIEIMKTTETCPRKTFFVFDDFHLIQSEKIIAFANRLVNESLPHICVILISRTEPEVNAVSLFLKGKASIITENDLRFTNSEIANVFKHYNISLASSETHNLADATKGWALAVNLLILALKRMPTNLDIALGSMRLNIFKLLETEAWNDFPLEVQKMLIKLSLVPDVPLSPLREMFDEDVFMRYLPQLSSFIWFDSLINNYRIHPFYLEFVKSKQYILSYEEQQDTYKVTAKWCFDNGLLTNAANYYAKSRQFERVLEILLSYPFKLPYETCEYFLGIIDEIEEVEFHDGKNGNNSVLILKHLFAPLLHAGMDNFEEASGQSLATIREFENADIPIANNLLCTAYNNLAYIETYTCTATNKFNSAKYLKKATEYYMSSPLPPIKVIGAFSVTDIRSFVCLVGDTATPAQFDEFVADANASVAYIEDVYHSFYYGYADLVNCEIALFKNQRDIAKNYAHNAILKAREKKQYSIEAVAQYYLLYLVMHDGDYSLTKELLKQLEQKLEIPDFWNRRIFYDLFMAMFYCRIGLPSLIPSWLVIEEKETSSGTHIPTRELITGIKYYLSVKKYDQALTILTNSYPRPPHERFLFGELILSLQFASARLGVGDTEGAVRDFTKAYKLSHNGEFEMPFIELGKSFHQLSAAVKSKKNCAIPQKWLAEIERKATVYTKKVAVITNAYKEEQNIADPVNLSTREQEVLSDLCHGLSREEIAIHRYLSVNTVKKVLQSIYTKLDASNNVDAIRIAIEKKLVN